MQKIIEILEKETQNHINSAKYYFNISYFLFTAVECHYIIEKSLKALILKINYCSLPNTNNLLELGEFLKAPEYIMSALRYLNMENYILLAPDSQEKYQHTYDKWKIHWVFDTVNQVIRWVNLYSGIDAEKQDIFNIIE